MEKNEKTNVMRVLEQQKIPYTPHYYDPACTDGERIAALLGEDPNHTFKTLVTTDGKKHYFVFVIPVNKALHLKKAAKAAGVKSIAMIPQKELLPLTGYIHGGCSPIGMKKKFATFIDRACTQSEIMLCSAGKVGTQIEVKTEQLVTFVRATIADVTTEKE
ncbi:MAG: Cys-tRNA(Pro) deacylase [Clostridia bacterium]|nr:Cys-tRNA(Pro) deacylase [Clostridia bacterium]